MRPWICDSTRANLMRLNLAAVPLRLGRSRRRPSCARRLRDLERGQDEQLDEAADDASLLSQAYQDARTFVRAEDFWATEYLLQLGPEADFLDPAALRREHARAAASLEGAHHDRAARRRPRPRSRARPPRLTREVLAERRMPFFDAVDAREPRRALAIELHQVDQLFLPLEMRVEREAAEHRATAERLACDRPQEPGGAGRRPDRLRRGAGTRRRLLGCPARLRPPRRGGAPRTG